MGEFMMQLEEVNRATSPQEYLAKLERWSKDRGMPGVDEPFSFTVVMQYCERLEGEIRQLQEQCEIWEACTREEIPGHRGWQPGTGG